MKLTKKQNDKIVKLHSSFLRFEFIDKLINDFNLSNVNSYNIITSAAAIEMYTHVKGIKECQYLGLKDKKELLSAVMVLSKEMQWTALSKTSSVGRIRKKISSFKKVMESGYYEALKKLVTGKINNTNARKITDEQLLFLQTYKLQNLQSGYKKVYTELKLKFPEIEITKLAVLYHLRKIEIECFKSRMK